MFCVIVTRGVNPGGWWGRDPQILCRGSWGSQGVVGDRGRVVKFYYGLSCTESMFESGDLNEQFLPGKSTFFKDCLKKSSKFIGNFLEKSKFCLPGSTTP